MNQQFQDPNQLQDAQPASSPAPAGHYSAPSPAAVPAASAPGVVGVGSVAGQVAEYIEIPGKGAVKMASMTQRLIARILDGVVLSIVILVVMVVAIAIVAGAASVDDGSGGAAGLGILGFLGLTTLGVVLVYAYEAVMIGFWGATVGKMALKVKVVKPRNGEAPGIGSGIVRFLIPGLCALIPFIGWLGTVACYISPTFDNSGRRQGWHDKVANTVVVSTAP
ncbi:predicted membrane protein/domain [Brachybacterium faecium DSM 4810]|uniref:Predicted membrane protein/domain n=1 Tax=Brachybacterium faecium (strain ATCC 43885 / DSM 4810 / JCM 11609 / LMG 19847 / NBRC 14762 / NCIMB 9860 / 6-10) TaxID=446465 RepID=C7M9V7_BRAFD|nr:RDD family protein [Brachybacterium faecium]ACU84651.1 predicted membrane protein/domain [Brachybacterium faecium DSM 4810]HJG50872.1 RDD family protein [Brachybacterium faecium]